MKVDFRKSLLLAGACTAMGVAYTPSVYAANANTSVQRVEQQKTVKGSVQDANGPIVGASVLVKGTGNGTVTDLDGNFSLDVSPNQTLVISYIGYKTQEIAVGNQSTISVTLEEENASLNEVVVVGYGVQKKKLVTGATVEVKGDDIQKMNTTQVLGALQSKTPGVNIQAASGQPGDGFKISIRGAGTNGNTTPLYVIDGVAGGDINNLNPADIERIDVLKDAASCAIYGSAAANGVILITTKQGKAGKVQVTYDGNIGWQDIYRMPDLLTAKEYMDVQDLVRFNSGAEPRDWSKYIDADLLAAYQNGSNPGTNWLDLLRNKNAVTTSHALNLAGGTDRSTFSGGVGYQYQDGVIGNFTKSDYRRFTIRLNSEHVVYRDSKGLDVVKIGENFYFSHKQNQGIQIGNQYNNAISDMLRANPCIPLYDKDGNFFDWADIQASGTEGWDKYNSYSLNPIYDMMNQQSGHNKSRNFNMNAVGYVEVQPIKNLVYRGQLNYNQSSWSRRTYLPVFSANEMTAGKSRTVDQVTQQAGLGWGWSTTQTVNYKFDVAKLNHFDVLAGMEYGESKPSYGESIGATLKKTTFGDFDHAYLSLTDAANRASNGMNVYGDPYGDSRGVSYFGRVNYDYNETYMLTAIIRADGTSTFAPGHRWGYFPSFSAGWVVSNEKFMQGVQDWMDYFKIRASWGQNGNKNLLNGSNFAYQATFEYGTRYNYSFDNNKDGYTVGAAPSRLANDELTWETSEQTDLGFDARFFRQRLNVNFDWYYKKTKDLLVQVPVAATSGFSNQWKNAGTVRNTGVELALDWQDKIGGDFSYGVNYNVAFNSNKVTEVNSQRKYMEGGNDLLAQGAGIIARFEEGHPIGYFYGYKTAGPIQNDADLQAYIAENCNGDAANSLQGKGLKAGDLKFQDVNGDGKINSEDKTELGDPNPNVTMGLTLSAAYRGFDFAVTGYAALGQQVARSYRKFTDGEQENYTSEVYSYWNGEGTSDKYPLLARMNEGVNWQAMSDIYIEDAGYFRLQNLTLGYDFKHLWKACPFQQLRLYFAAQNLFTITGYKGMDPENGMALNSSEPWVTGVDVGNYPQPRTFMFGVNVKF